MVKLMKVSQIKEEIQLIAAKDQEARKLEKTEEQLIKRLKETYLLQQMTLGEIKDLFTENGTGNLSESQSLF